jgi:hypothetical protein
MATRPSADPDWAENYAVDPTSGQGNRVEPPQAWKDDGWDYQEKPPRNYDNWAKWNLGQWVKYLDAEIVRAGTKIVAASNASAQSKNHADYVCDGTDDQTEINAAITAAATIGGTVLLSEGTFTIDGAINLATKVHLRGMGMEATIIEVDTGTSSDFTMLLASSKSRLSISALTLDGNAASIAQNTVGIEINGCSHVQVFDVEVREIDTDGSDGYGFEINGSSYVFVTRVEVNTCQVGVYITGSCHTIELLQVLADNNTTFGFALGSDYTSMVSCTARSNGNGGLTLSGQFCRVIGCTFRGNAAGDGISIPGGSYNVIAGCVIDHNDYHGIALSSTAIDNIICDCLIVQNSQGTHATYDGICIDTGESGVDWNTITGCKIRRGTSSPQHRYGINLAGSADNYVYNNDVVAGGITGQISATGRTIPEWVCAGADSSSTNNVQDDVTKANRIA